MGRICSVFVQWFCLYGTWNEKNIRLWQLKYQNGIQRHVGLVGVLFFGGLFFLPMLAFHKPSPSNVTILLSLDYILALKFMLCMAMGLAFGVLTWHCTLISFNRAAYERE